MTEPLTLVAKPKASDEIRDSVIALLRKTLAEAERGEIDFVALVAGSADGDWIPRISTVGKLSLAIGRIEIAKQEWILDYLKQIGRA